ncbi:hypothetical protein ACQ4PT_000270 [Festuca glaucescens]
MARSSADDMELKRACEAGILSKEKVPEKVALSMRVAKGRVGPPRGLGIAGKLTSRHYQGMAKPRVLAVTRVTDRFFTYIHTPIDYQPAKVYKIKHLHKVEVASSDPSGCTFILGFDNLKSQSISPPQWTLRNKDDRNRLLMCILNLCKELLGGIPKVVGMDIVEMAIWAKENTTTKVTQVSTKDGPIESAFGEAESQVTVEKDLVSQAEEEDIEALLGTYVMAIGEAEAFSERMKRELVALESANVYALMETESVVEEVLQGLEVASICVEDMDEWLGIFNIKLRHMREDIQSIEWRNNRLELQSVSNVALGEELDKLLVFLQIPPEYEESLTGGSFDEGNMVKNTEACEWLTSAIKNLEVSNLDPCYAKLRAVREKRAEFVLLKCTFVRRAAEFLRNYFPSLIDSMLNDKGNFSQAREFSNELRSSSKVSKSSTPFFEGPAGSSAADLGVLNQCLQELLDGIQEDFYAIVDWAFKLDPLSCIAMHGITDRYISAQKAEVAGYVPVLLDDLETRITILFGRHFEKLFQYARRVEELMYNMSPEEIPFQVGMSKVDFRKMLKSSLTGLDKTINAMYRKLQKNITAEELIPSLWEKCKKEFLDKYATFLKLIAKIYPNETVTSVNDMRDTLAAL